MHIYIVQTFQQYMLMAPCMHGLQLVSKTNMHVYIKEEKVSYINIEKDQIACYA